jgi:hypothetical protein
LSYTVTISSGQNIRGVFIVKNQITDWVIKALQEFTQKKINNSYAYG